jgi:glycosyltransferase involved in cell wall biosynthesis
MQRAYVSVINDLSTDQRVHRTCITLQKMGYEVTLIGRKLSNSIDIVRPYHCQRMTLLVNKGPFFYASFNARLFFILLFKKKGLLFANDLDTLQANFLVSKIKGSKIIYDSHEYFTEVPELQNTALKKKIWKWLERSIVPHLKNCITVNQSIAELFREKYGVSFSVVRNIPLIPNLSRTKTREELGLPTDKKIIILQGSGINVQRGAEEAVEAMQYVNDAVLLIIGGGDVLPTLKNLYNKLKLDEKVKFIPKKPYEELLQYTRNADIGLTLDKDTNINYRYSLPNKLFDYIHCNTPVLGSDLIEVKNIIKKYDLGEIIESYDPEHIAEKINFMLSDAGRLNTWKQNCKKATQELNWSKEETVLMDVIKKA